MRNPNRKSKAGAIGLLIVAAVMSMSLASCANRYASSTSDNAVCVFDGSKRGGQKLKFQIAPGAASKKIDRNDKPIKIVASNRFALSVVGRKLVDDGKGGVKWEYSQDSKKDPLMPDYYTGFAKGNVAVQLEGQVRFKFNLKTACDWYSKHGRRNADKDGDLRFGARGDDALQSGWFRFLSENFGLTMQEVATERLSSYSWPAMVYNYPADADPETGNLDGKKASEATNIKLGVDLGKVFTNRLNANLGGQFFCGIDEVVGDSCPPMRFQVVAVHTQDPNLEQSRQEVENTKAQLESDQLEGDLREQQQSALVRAEQARRAALQEKLQTADVQAQIDTAKCRIYAGQGLDCDGKRPAVIVSGGSPVN